VPLSGQHPGGSEHIVVELQGGAHLMTSHQASSIKFSRPRPGVCRPDLGSVALTG
jgi:hypothetical protein